jgi:hypothetical protein
VQLLRSLFQPLWEVTATLPLPWRVATVAVPLALAGWWLLPRLVPWVLRALARVLEGATWLVALAEYGGVTAVRRLGRRPPAGLGVVDAALSWCVRVPNRFAEQARRSKPLRRAIRVALVLLLAVPLVSWYGRPYTEPRTALRGHLDRGVRLSTSVESWFRTGVWTTASHRRPAAKKPPVRKKAKRATREK